MDNPPHLNSSNVTLFIPTYQRPKMIKKAIESCQSQSYKNVVIFVSDNCSKDETPEVVASLAKDDPRIHYFCHSKHLKMLEHYQFGLDTIESEFFSFLSDDDILLPSFVETALLGFSTFPDIAFFSCSTALIEYESKKIIDIPLHYWPREGRFTPEETLPIMVSRWPVPTTILFRKTYALKATIDFTNPVVWDCDFLIQLAEQFPIAISKKICGVFHSHTGSASKEKDFRLPFQKIFQKIETSSSINEPLKVKMRPSMKRLLYRVNLHAIISTFQQGEIIQAKRLAATLFRGNRKPKAFIAYLVTYLCSIAPQIHPFFLFLLKIKRRYKNRMAVTFIPK